MGGIFTLRMNPTPCATAYSVFHRPAIASSPFVAGLLRPSPAATATAPFAVAHSLALFCGGSPLTKVGSTIGDLDRTADATMDAYAEDLR